MGGEENISPRTEMVNRNFDVQMLFFSFLALSGLIILLLITYLKKQHKCSHLDCKGSGTLSALVPVAEILCATA